MKLQKIFILSFLINPVFLFNLYARSTTYRQPNGNFPIPFTDTPRQLSVRCIITYKVSVPGDTRWVRLTALTPESMPNIQKIKRIDYSIKPFRFFRQNGNRYAEFMIQNPDRIEKLEIIISAELYSYDLQTAKENKNKNEFQETGLEEYLRHERYIEKDDRQILKIAKAIEGTTEIQIVRKIYNYVLDTMEYAVHGKKDRGALKALQYKKGDCSEYADLFVAICRAKKIPARVVTGISVQSDTSTAKHNWAEVYLKDYGWVPFDPSKGDVKFASLQDRLFSTLEPTYIYYSHLRNDNILQNFHYCAFSYFGDEVKVTDSVEFEFPKSSK